MTMGNGLGGCGGGWVALCRNEGFGAYVFGSDELANANREESWRGDF